uniref:IS200/IS605 family transposase n=1 Tax=Ignavibacterium album TaxID=591197 RepID=A0A7V2ZJ33_9BACT
MSWVRVWVHLVFSTKNREPYLNSRELREKVFNHIKDNAKEKDIWLDSINGYKEHIHCLISLNKEQSISKIAQLIKGESSFWINKNKLTKNKFIWQDDYWAVSVSESHIENVKKYISEQEEHHRIKTVSEEVDEFMKKYGWYFIQNTSYKE